MKHRECIEIVYNYYYLHNLRQVLDKLAFEWCHPATIRENPKTVPWAWDPYLRQNRDNKVGLARNILEIGTYWPFVITDNGSISEGCHRIHSIKLLDTMGEWPPDRKILSITFPDKFSLIRSDWQRPEKKIDMTPFSFEAVPMYCTSIKNEVKYLHKEMTPETVIMDQICPLYKLLAGNYIKMMDIYVTLPIYLRYELYFYNKIGDIIKPNPIINDEATFYRWYFNS
jgi:hypothetical protein